ncbi:hypothetical protein BD626DRAFT_414108, partial [Schizophyllum amplum]
ALPISKKRPAEVGAWKQRARSTKYKPVAPKKKSDVDDWICDFKDAIWAWWSDINPSWRERDKGRVVPCRGEGDFSGLCCTGQNGLLSVLKCLKWLFDMEKAPNGSEDWRTLVDDVRWVLERLPKVQR